VLDEAFITEVDQVKELILSEINVKELQYVTDSSGLLKKSAKANFKTLGAKCGKDMKLVAIIIETWDDAHLAKLEREGHYAITQDGRPYDILLEDVILKTEDLPGWKSASDGSITVALDVNLTDALLAEGTARDLVNRIQNIRKEKDFNVTDRIEVRIERHPAIEAAVEQYGEYIKEEVLANSLVLADSVDGEAVELNDEVTLAMDVSVYGLR
jgi:isoleucyl-tRNA synthetase